MLAAGLVSGCAAVGMLQGGGQVGGWLGVVALLVAGCFPKVANEQPGRFRYNYVGDFDASQITLAYGGDGTNGFVVIENNYPAYMGHWVAAGDLNGDGFADIAIGSPFYGPTTSGQVTVIYGGPGPFSAGIDPDTLTPTQGRMFRGGSPNDHTGAGVAI